VLQSNWDGILHAVLTDQLGTPLLLLDRDEEVRRQWRYDALGQILSDSAPAEDFPIGFAGGLVDAATGFVRFGLRDYDPHTGRWISPSPLGLDGGDPNAYRYAGGDFVGHRAPDGAFGAGFPFHALTWGGSRLVVDKRGDAQVCTEIDWAAGLALGANAFPGAASSRPESLAGMSPTAPSTAEARHRDVLGYGAGGPQLKSGPGFADLRNLAYLPQSLFHDADMGGAFVLGAGVSPRLKALAETQRGWTICRPLPW